MELRLKNRWSRPESSQYQSQGLEGGGGGERREAGRDAAQEFPSAAPGT